MNLSVFEVRRIAIGRGETGGEIVRGETLDLDQYRWSGIGVDLTEGTRQMLFDVIGFEEVELDVAQVALVVRDVSPPCAGPMLASNITECSITPDLSGGRQSPAESTSQRMAKRVLRPPPQLRHSEAISVMTSKPVGALAPK